MRVAARLLTFLFLGVLVWFAAGCMHSRRIRVVADPPSGHPCAEDGGLCVRIQCAGGEPPYSISFGDGKQVSSETGDVQHVYEPPYSKNRYRITATCEGGIGFANVSIENEPPVFYGIFSVKGNLAQERELVLLQVNHFTKGCSDCGGQCEPYRIYGGVDPDGDVLYFEWNIRKQGASQEDSVYAVSGHRVNGVAASGEYFIWFPKWRKEEPPWPFRLPSLGTARNGMVCAPRARLASSIRPKGNYYNYTVEVTVSDFCGASDTYEEVWEVLEPFN